MRKRTPRSSVRTRVSEAAERIGRVWFQRSDSRARRRGWEVWETGRLNRSYRDPRFDRLIPCVWCEGQGCPECDWTGRVERRPSWSPR